MNQKPVPTFSQENASILVSGGTGSFGKAFVETVLERHPSVKRLVISSRDELKRFELALQFSPQVSFEVGVASKRRLSRCGLAGATRGRFRIRAHPKLSAPMPTAAAARSA